MSEWLSITDIEKRTGIPTPTLRRYLSRHGHHLLYKKRHKGYLVSEDSISVLTKIRDCYADGLDTEQVEDALIKGGVPLMITVNDHDDRVSVTASEALMELKEEVIECMSLVVNELQELRSEISATKEENVQLRQWIDGRLKQTEDSIMDTLGPRASKKKRGFLKRLFSK